MVLPSHQLEAARVVLWLQHDLVSDLVGLTVYSKVEIGLSNDSLLSIAYHIHLKLRLKENDRDRAR